MRLSRFAALLALVVTLAASPTKAQTSESDSMRAERVSTPTETEAPVQRDTVLAKDLFRTASEQLQRGARDSALVTFNRGLDADPMSVGHAYGKAQVLVQLERFDEAIPALRHAVEMAEEQGRTQIYDAANSMFGQVSYNRASDLMQTSQINESQAQRVLVFLEAAEESGIERPSLPYYFAKAYNAIGQYEEAVSYAEAAVEANSDQSDLSPYYIELGIAKMNTGNSEAARAAFEQAKNGAWSQWAEHYLSQLESEETPSGGEEAAGS